MPLSIFLPFFHSTKIRYSFAGIVSNSFMQFGVIFLYLVVVLINVFTIMQIEGQHSCFM